MINNTDKPPIYDCPSQRLVCLVCRNPGHPDDWYMDEEILVDNEGIFWMKISCPACGQHYMIKEVNPEPIRRA